MNLYKIFKIIVAILSLAGAVFLAMIMSKGDEAIEDAAKLGESTAIVDYMTYVSYAVLVIILVLVIIFVLKNLLSDPKSLKSTLMGVGVFAVVLIISYVVSGGDPTAYFSGDDMSSPEQSQLVGAGIVAFYILLFGAIAAMLFSGVKKTMSK